MMFKKKKMEEEYLLSQLSNISEPTTFQFKEVRSVDKSKPMFELLVINSGGEQVVSHLSKTIEYSFSEIERIVRLIKAESPQEYSSFALTALSSTHYSIYQEKFEGIFKDIQTKNSESIIIKEIDVDKIKYLTPLQVESLFYDFCWQGNLNCLKDLVENSFLASSTEEDNKKAEKIVDVGFHRACSGGHLSVVKYFKENTKLGNLVTSYGFNDGLLFSLNKASVNKEYFEIVKHLLVEYDFEVSPENRNKAREIGKKNANGLKI